jgi:hypothetical protein
MAEHDPRSNEQHDEPSEKKQGMSTQTKIVIGIEIFFLLILVLLGSRG